MIENNHEKQKNEESPITGSPLNSPTPSYFKTPSPSNKSKSGNSSPASPVPPLDFIAKGPFAYNSPNPKLVMYEPPEQYKDVTSRVFDFQKAAKTEKSPRELIQDRKANEKNRMTEFKLSPRAISSAPSSPLTGATSPFAGSSKPIILSKRQSTSPTSQQHKAK